MIPATKKVLIVGASPHAPIAESKGCPTCNSKHSMWQLDHVVSCTPCFEDRKEAARREYLIEEGIDPDSIEEDPMDDYPYEEDDHDY